MKFSNPFAAMKVKDLPVLRALPGHTGTDQALSLPPDGALPPVHLTSRVVLQSSSDQDSPVGVLQNPWGVPIEVCEAKFQVHAATTDVPGGASVTALMSLGKHRITDNPIPVFCFGAMKPVEGENVFTPSSNANAEHVFRFPKPCLLLAGEAIRFSLRHTGLVAGNIAATVSLAGRLSAQKNPTVRAIPYASGYASKAFTTYAAADIDQSNPTTDLRNSLEKTLHVDRFVGRVIYFNNGVAALGNNDGQPDMSQRLLRVRMSRSDGRATVKDFTLFGNVFCRLTRTWECPHLLAPGAFYQVFLDKLAAAVAINPTDTSQAFVTLVGWREERLPARGEAS